MYNIYNNYVITKKLSLDLGEAKQQCNLLNAFVKTNITNGDYSVQDNLDDSIYLKYNVFLYPSKFFFDLYLEIKDVFRELDGTKEPHYIRAWLNYYNEGQYIDWHKHWYSGMRAYHGFYCVDTEPSKTTYKFPDQEETVDIISEDNLLVIGKCDDDSHRTWPWQDATRPRITLGYDIVPYQYITPPSKPWKINHWSPI